MIVSRILIIGATSAIAEATARLYAARGSALYLLGRDAQRTRATADDLRVRGARSVQTATLDVADLASHEEAINLAWAAFDGLDLALIAHGTLPDESRCTVDVEYTVQELTINAIATIALANRVAQQLKAQGNGTLAVISSVAGDRGRASNFVYGSAKAAVTAYLSGLRQRLNGCGVNVLTVKPGFVDTPMTAAFKKSMLWAEPDAVARGIVRAVDHGRAVVYLPWFWRPIMVVIRCIPEMVFRHIRL